MIQLLLFGFIALFIVRIAIKHQENSIRILDSTSDRLLEQKIGNGTYGYAWLSNDGMVWSPGKPENTKNLLVFIRLGLFIRVFRFRKEKVRRPEQLEEVLRSLLGDDKLNFKDAVIVNIL